jgi:predicted Zn-ribbon and HTH transcriptional regulator
MNLVIISKYLLFITLFVSSNLIAQRVYHFDRHLIYEQINHSDSSKNKVISVLTNSNDSSYAATILNFTATEYRLEFFQDQVLNAYVSVDKNLFNKGDDLVLDCSGIRKWSWNYSDDHLRLGHMRRDTIIADQSYTLVELFQTNRKGRRKKKPHKVVYVMDGSVEHVPPFRWPTRFEYYEASEFVKRGVPVLIRNFTTNSSLELREMKTRYRRIIIPEKCNLEG